MLRPLGGVPLLVRTVRGLLDSGVVDGVLVAVPSVELDAVRTLFGAVLGRPGGRKAAVEVIGCPADGVSVGRQTGRPTGVVGSVDSVSAERQTGRPASPVGYADSVSAERQTGRPASPVGVADRVSALSAALWRGLERHPDTRIVLVHDAARALTPPSLIRAMVEAVGDGTGCKAVVPVLPVADTVKRAAGSENRVIGTVDRSSLRTAQTPAAFHRELLERALASAATEPVSPRRGEVWLVERLGEKVRAVPGDPLAFHIGSTWDLRIASLLADA
ncbi:2-C-methyl-D-erythritol 4-phosphate cytidylyltransferase [Pseudonocardia eucalypti]|uniref:IspD/TarI family cytidylyltransferase n=1 Tax=Pseudonocardia eucalypti TaxID=648755 RepID=UPI00178D659A|nr:2-C-methyl-D-erythritol 4-phosphate cytidylyltransferase [Pseudonocardia eucalypti]